ncbi:MAG: hypothetical protein JW746_05555 [Candidatus Krumholzibacteriota bacterium]|nr:hypothetical protein [Candidatus Krumholzibacteriota bacterium]
MKLYAACIVFIVLLLPSAAVAQWNGEGAEMRLTTPKIVNAEPGQIITAGFLLSNNSDLPLDLVESLDLSSLPEGWEPMIEYERELTLEPGKQWFSLVTFRVPQNCPAGSYEAVYSYRDRAGDGIIRDSITVVVDALLELEATINNALQFILAGNDYSFCMLLVNKGNCSADFTIEAEASHGFTIAVEPSCSTIGPGSSKTIEFTVNTKEDIKKEIGHIVKIIAKAESAEGETTTLERTVVTEIIPRLTRKIERYNTISTRARLIAVGGKEEGGFQVEYSGNGSINEEGTRRMSFLLRGPDQQNKSIYGLRDAVRLDYSDQLIDLHAGDRLFTMSHLTELLTFGRGIEGRLHAKGMSLGSFYIKSRWDVPEKREVGVYAGYSHKKLLSVGTNFLAKSKLSEPTFEGYEGNIYSVSATVTPGKKLRLGMEYGYSVSDSKDRGNDFAHRISLDGQLSDRMWYIFENTRAGAEYLGYYGDVLYNNGTVAFPIFDRLKGNFSYRFHERNLDLDPDQDSAPRERSFSGEIAYPFTFGLNISLNYDDFARKDELADPLFDYSEKILRLGACQSFDRVGIQTYAERALFDDRVHDESNKVLERYSIYTYLRLKPGVSISAFTRIGHSRFTGTPTRTVNTGVSTSVTPVNWIRFSLNYQKNNMSKDDDLQAQHYFFSTADLSLPNGHSIALKARWFEFEDNGRDDLSFQAAYTIPFRVPVTKNRSFGVLKGRVFEGDRAANRPRANILLAAGDLKTVTDSEGIFTFPPLEPGTYALRVDQKSISLNETTSGTNPTIVTVEGGEETARVIEVVPECQVAGQVLLLEPDRERLNFKEGGGFPEGSLLTGAGGAVAAPLSPDDMKIVGGYPDLFVELTDGNKVLRQETDRSGRFSFINLHPGRWHLTVYEYGLPTLFRFEKDQFDLDLDAGENTNLVINIIPQLRPIEFIGGGEIAESGGR